MTGYGVRPCPVFVGAILGRSGGNCGLPGRRSLGKALSLRRGTRVPLVETIVRMSGGCCALRRRGVAGGVLSGGRSGRNTAERGAEAGRKSGTAYAAGAGKTLRPEGVWMFPAVVVWVRRRYCRQALRLDGVLCRCRRAGGVGSFRWSWSVSVELAGGRCFRIAVHLKDSVYGAACASGSCSFVRLSGRGASLCPFRQCSGCGEVRM